MTERIFNSIERLQNFPLDIDSIFNTENDLNDYVSREQTAYSGQMVYVEENKTFYGIYSDGASLKYKKLIDITSHVEDSDVDNSYGLVKPDNVTVYIKDGLLCVRTTIDDSTQDFFSSVKLFMETSTQEHADIRNTIDEVNVKHAEDIESIKNLIKGICRHPDFRVNDVDDDSYISNKPLFFDISQSSSIQNNINEIEGNISEAVDITIDEELIDGADYYIKGAITYEDNGNFEIIQFDDVYRYKDGVLVCWNDDHSDFYFKLKQNQILINKEVTITAKITFNDFKKAHVHKLQESYLPTDLSGFKGSGNGGYYGVCHGEDVNPNLKTNYVVYSLDIKDFELNTGTSVQILFTDTNKQNFPVFLNISGTGRKRVVTNGQSELVVRSSAWYPNQVVDFVYDGDCYQAIGLSQAISNNNCFGLVKLTDNINLDTGSYQNDSSFVSYAPQLKLARGLQNDIAYTKTQLYTQYLGFSESYETDTYYVSIINVQGTGYSINEGSHISIKFAHKISEDINGDVYISIRESQTRAPVIYFGNKANGSNTWEDNETVDFIFTENMFISLGSDSKLQRDIEDVKSRIENNVMQWKNI